jgi:hypothetical protein
MGSDRNCSRCGAPVPGFLQDVVPDIRPVGQQPAKPSRGRRILRRAVGVVNFFASYYAIVFVVTAITARTDPAPGTDYPALWACCLGAIACGSVPALTIYVKVRRRRRRAMGTPVVASNAPQLLSQSLD